MSAALPIAPSDAREAEILLYSYYRDAELRGSNLLFRLLRVLEDPASQLNLTRHIADEARHAWLWTRRIRELGGLPVPVEDGYQVRMGLRAGMTRRPLDLLALTYVAEERAMARYQEHLERPDVSLATRDVLSRVSQDEVWHVGWVLEKARELAAQQGEAGLADAAVERFRRVDREVTAELEELEAKLLGGLAGENSLQGLPEAAS